MQLTVVDHPLARARLSRMRDERTDNAAFRAANVRAGDVQVADSMSTMDVDSLMADDGLTVLQVLRWCGDGCGLSSREVTRLLARRETPDGTQAGAVDA